MKCHVATSQIAKILTLSFNALCGLIERVVNQGNSQPEAGHPAGAKGDQWGAKGWVVCEGVLHLSPAVEGGGNRTKWVCVWKGEAVTARPLTLRRQPSPILKPVGTKPAANPIHRTSGWPRVRSGSHPAPGHPLYAGVRTPLQLPTAIQRANDSLTQDGGSRRFLFSLFLFYTFFFLVSKHHQEIRSGLDMTGYSDKDEHVLNGKRHSNYSILKIY